MRLTYSNRLCSTITRSFGYKVSKGVFNLSLLSVILWPLPKTIISKNDVSELNKNIQYYLEYKYFLTTIQLYILTFFILELVDALQLK